MIVEATVHPLNCTKRRGEGVRLCRGRGTIVLLLRLLVLTICLVAGQAHACVGEWTLPDGSECGRCETQLPSVQDERSGEWTTSPDDCRACCELSECERDAESSLATAAPDHEVAARIETAVLLPARSVAAPRAVHVVLAECLPNAPPERTSSRAPPHF